MDWLLWAVLLFLRAALRVETVAVGSIAARLDKLQSRWRVTAAAVANAGLRDDNKRRNEHFRAQALAETHGLTKELKGLRVALRSDDTAIPRKPPSRTPSQPFLAAQNTAHVPAINGIGNLSASKLYSAYGLLPIEGWKVNNRRLGSLDTTQAHCTAHTDCERNEYCMSCKKCTEFHASLSKEDQEKWTCEPCGDDGGHCESGRYCDLAGDSVDGICPSFPGCTSHIDCPEKEYCYSCESCARWIEGTNYDLLWKCQPCNHQEMTGFCSMDAWCKFKQDSIDNVCPQNRGCDSHNDCHAGQYCESCELCDAHKRSLPQNEQALWNCGLCPTSGGGTCEDLRFCEIANDGIDHTCPQPHGCNSHAQCLPDQYCFDCEKCEEYRGSLPSQDRDQWACGPCPTQRGGACGLRMFCEQANDSVTDGPCPLASGCAKHEDCNPDKSFCMDWHRCAQEIGSASCGSIPENGGICIQNQLCTPARSIDNKCPVVAVCSSHMECPTGLFCTLWEDCMNQDSTVCGQKSIHYDGVCVPLQHCVRGLHKPIDGSCPVGSSGSSTLEAHEVLKLKGTMQLATHHQAMNVWRDEVEGSERVLAQLHDYGRNLTDRDDSEYVGIYKVGESGSLKRTKLVELSCPSVEISIPSHPRYFYEARIYMTDLELSMTHSECSCVRDDPMGYRCPRGLGFQQGSDDRSCATFTPVEDLTGANVDVEVFGQEYRKTLSACRGPVEFSTDMQFEIRFDATSTQATVTIMDPANGRIRIIKQTNQDADGETILRYDGKDLRCTSTKKRGCQRLDMVRNEAIPALVVDIYVIGVRGFIRGGQFCAHCMPTTTELSPVVFFNANGVVLSNSLTLYTLESDVVAPARLVDSSLGGGEGKKEWGCPSLTDPAGKVQTLEGIRAAGKRLPLDHVNGKWCVVHTGGCPLTDKYMFCVAGGATAVLILKESHSWRDYATDGEDAIAEIHLDASDSVDKLIPVVFGDLDRSPELSKLYALLLSGEEPTVHVGPHVGADPTKGSNPSMGGIRVYDTGHDAWIPQTKNPAMYEKVGDGLCKGDLSSSWHAWDSPHHGGLHHEGKMSEDECKQYCSRMDCGAYAYCQYSDCKGDCYIYSTSEDYSETIELVANQSWDGIECYRKHMYDGRNEYDFHTFRWIEHSRVREVLFGCTSGGRVVAFSTADPSTGLPMIGKANSSFSCETAPLLRDFHIVDMKQGNSFFTLLIDPAAHGNMLHFFDTTDLHNWRHIHMLHAAWEHNERGLGQVVATLDSTKLLATWHCSSMLCHNTETGTSEGQGERLYILDVQNLTLDMPKVAGIVDLPMSTGSIARDVSCNADNICATSLTWDGIVVIDLNPGPSKNRIVAQHSMAFQLDTEAIPEEVAFLRFATGAQKIYPSLTTKNTFYVERWSMDTKAFTAGASLTTTLRFDSVWALTLENYNPVVSDSQEEEILDPTVRAYVIIAIGWEKIIEQLPHGDINRLKDLVAVALRDALGVDEHRLFVTDVWRVPGREYSEIQVGFHILQGVGASPSTLYNMLETQWATPGSAIHTGPLKEYMEKTRLEKAWTGGWSPKGRGGGMPNYKGAQPGASGVTVKHDSSLPLLMVTGVCIVIAAWAIAIGWRFRQKAKRAVKIAESADRERREVLSQREQERASPSTGGGDLASNSGITGQPYGGQGQYVIGRPHGASGEESAAGSVSSAVPPGGGGANTPYVVGTPVAPGSNAASAPAPGLALTQIDMDKMAQGAGTSTSSATPAPSAATAAEQSADPPAAVAVAVDESDDDEEEGPEVMVDTGAAAVAAPASVEPTPAPTSEQAAETSAPPSSVQAKPAEASPSRPAASPGQGRHSDGARSLTDSESDD